MGLAPIDGFLCVEQVAVPIAGFGPLRRGCPVDTRATLAPFHRFYR